MSFRDLLTDTFRTLWAHKLRTALTMFGIAWGVISITLMVAAGEGLRSGRRLFWESTDHQFIQQEAPDCDIVVPEQGNGVSVTSAFNSASLLVTGSLPPFAKIRSLPVAEGRFYSWEDDALARRVAFLGTDAKQQLFGSRPALGQTIRVGMGVAYGLCALVNLLPMPGFFDGMLAGWQPAGFSFCLLGLVAVLSAVYPARRAGKVIRFEREDVEAVQQEATLVTRICMESVRGRPAVDQTVTIAGLRFTVIGVLESKMQDSSYFSPDNQSAFIPYSTAGFLWDTRYAGVLVFTPLAPQFEARAMDQVRAAIAKRAIQMFGREEFRPIIDGILIGLQTLLTFIGCLTLAIGGVGIMNIMLVSVDERVREIGVRRALGARRLHIGMQFLAEALTLTLAGGLIGIALAYLLSAAIGPISFVGEVYDDTTGRGDIRLIGTPLALMISTGVLILTGVLSGLFPAIRASRLDPAEALRYE
jgi:ABC-type antimicrobial peptide transport system permease subunit